MLNFPTDKILNDPRLSRTDKHKMKKALVGTLRPLKYMHQAIPYECSAERYDTYINTMKRNSIEPASYQKHKKCPFYKLTYYDKINTHKSDPYFLKLNNFLIILNKHIDIVKIINEAKSFSTVYTSYKNHEEFIGPVLNSYDNVLLDNDNNSSLEIQKVILNEYSDNPMAISTAIQYSLKDDLSSLFPKDFKTILASLSKRIISSKLQISKKDIAKSLQCYIINLYKDGSISNQLLTRIPKIQDKTLITLAGEISKKYICKDTKKPSSRNLYSKTNEIDFIEGVFILQPTIIPHKTPIVNSYNGFLKIF